MSLNDVQLPASVITGLYKKALIASNDVNTGITKEQPVIGSGYKFLGKNKKAITVINNSKEAVFLTEADLNFLTKLLGACKMNLEDIAILNQATEEINIAAMKKQLSPSAVLFFGVEPNSIKLPIHFPMFKLQEYDGCVYLSAPKLEELNQDTNEGKVLKSKLWVCLKQLLGL